MKIKLITLLIITVIFSACTSTTNVLTTEHSLAPAPKVHRASNVFLVDLEQVSGNTLYIDRKAFKEALTNSLRAHKADIGYNPNAHLIVHIDQTKLNENRFKATHHNYLQYRIDRKIHLVVDYTMYGKSQYHNSFTYNVLVKSGSYISFDDADRKAHKILFRKLGNMVAQRVLALRHRFR